MATSSVSNELLAQAKHWESEVSLNGKLLAEHNRAVETGVAAIADLDVALGNLQNANKATYGPVLAHLRNRRDSLVNELATVQAQVSQVRATYDGSVKMRDAFTEAANALAPVAPQTVGVMRKGK